MSRPQGFGPVGVPWHETEDEDYASLVAELNAEGEREMEREAQMMSYYDRQEGPQ